MSITRNMTNIKAELLEYATICEILKTEGVKINTQDDLERYLYVIRERYGYPEAIEAHKKASMAKETLDMRSIVKPLRKLAERFAENESLKMIS